jgi:hypothetical protein
MQINKQVITIVILASLLFSAIGTALFFYKKNQQTLKAKSELVTIFIAKENIPKDTLLTIENLSQTTIAKEYILNPPLLKEEIIGKYTNENIYKHEIFLKQKLDTEIKKEQKNILEFEKSAYNMKFELFKNPNYALQQGEYINIISVFPLGESDNKGRFQNFDVRYIAPSIKILGFIRDGRYEAKSITKHKIKKIVNKVVEEVEEEIKADEIVLDIDLNVLLKLIKNYNLGTQLWMTKTTFSAEYLNELQNDKKDLENPIVEINMQNLQVREAVVKKYKYTMYQPSKSVIQKSALIDYSNNSDESITKNVDIAVNSSKLCETIKDHFIVGTPTSFYVRSEATKNSTEKFLLSKNTIIPFIDKQDDWYKTCDQRFIHESVVNEVDSSFVKEKLGKDE